MLRWFVIGAGAALAVGLTLTLGPRLMNARVMDEMRAEPDGERARRVMMLHFPGGKTLPVNYLREGNRVYAGADFGWWRAFRGEGAPVEVWIRGELLRGTARAVTDDPDHKRDVFSRLRTGVPDWLPEWLDAVLVEIRLEPR